MTIEHVQEDALNMHFDGELAPEEASAVQRHLTDCSECAQRLSSLARLREMISMSAMQAAGAVDFDAAFGVIEKATRAQPSATWSERAVVWVRETLDHRPARVWVPVAGTALAAAAAAIIAIRGVSPDPGIESAKRAPRDDRSKPAPMMLAQAPSEVVPEEPTEGSAASEIVQVDFGSNTGTVFEIALADGASTPVVWINDEE